MMDGQDARETQKVKRILIIRQNGKNTKEKKHRGGNSKERRSMGKIKLGE
jgi:hypothetical protein